MVGSRSRPVPAEDRLSSLPDDILYIIMSFLPARQAVQTCVLSHRWEGLWSSVPCLGIDEREFNTAALEARASTRFEVFVTKLLMFHKTPSLDMFRLHVTQNYEADVVSRWLSRGIERRPVVVEISTSTCHLSLKLPYLGSRACRIKKLHLVGITLEYSFMPHLPSYCSVLEDLKLDRCHNFRPPEIVSCTLKNLIVMDCEIDTASVLNITAPNLVSFHLVITVNQWRGWRGVSVNEMLSLAKAMICLKQDSSELIPPNGSCELLCSLTNVRDLELSGSKTLSILNQESDTVPTFPNLRTLLLDGCDLSDDFQMLEYFLNSAPSLEKLTLQYCKLPDGAKKRKRTDNPKRISMKCQDTLNFQCTNLKLVEIKHNEDDIHQLFDLLSGIWRNLWKFTIVLTKEGIIIS